MTTARSAYDAIEAYATGHALRAATVDLSDNTNRWGMPPAARNALVAAASAVGTAYPEPYAETLKAAIAEYTGATPKNVVTGCGSDDILDCAMRALADPGDRLALSLPTFVMVNQFARLNGLTPVPVPLTEECDVDAAAIRSAEARIIYICSPNNPTGTPASRERVAQLASGNAALIVDEAYAEFAGHSFIDLALQRDNVLVVRTFSKAFGLAGLRVGYAIGAPKLVAAVEKARGPYKVNDLAARAAIAALQQGLPWVREHAALASEQRERLRSALVDRGLAPLPSRANFVFAPIADASAIARRMRQMDVGVRAYGNLPPFTAPVRDAGLSALRITVGPSDEMDRALAALDQALQEVKPA